MISVESISIAVTDLREAVSRSEVGSDKDVTAILANLDRRMTQWLASMTTILDASNVLTNAEDLLLALRRLHPSGLPENLKPAADRMLKVMEDAVEWGHGFDLEPLRDRPETPIGIDRDTIHSAAVELSAGIAASEDAKVPSIAESREALDAALANWARVRNRLPEAEPVLIAANALLDAVHAENPEGLPFPYRDQATRMLTVIDDAEGQGFAVEAPAPRF